MVLFWYSGFLQVILQQQYVVLQTSRVGCNGIFRRSHRYGQRPDR